MKLNILLLLVSSMLISCSVYRNPPRDDNQYSCPPGDTNDPRASFELLSPALMDIHLTQQGALVDRCQWTALMYQLTNRGAPDTRSKIILLHIHGWKNNADPESLARERFSQLLEDMALEERNKNSNTQVVGVYVAWPALTIKTLGLSNFSFFSRKAVADRISQSAIVAKLIGAIENVTEQRKADGHEDVFIMMGYSFGARILFNATSQLALYSTQLAKPKLDSETYKIVDGPGDLVVLLNPALSASNYSAIDSIRRSSEKFSPQQNPVYLMVNTSNDLVNKFAYPLAHWFALDWNKERRTSVGGYRAYDTHSLLQSPSTVNGTTPDKAINGAAWFDQFCAQSLCLSRLQPASDERNRQPTNVSQSSNPFIVARTTPEIINGHNGFWESSVFSDWLSAFVNRTLEGARKIVE